MWHSERLINAVAGSPDTPSWPEAKPGPHAAYIPNVTVRTHTGQASRFYDDLIRQRIVLINCMSIRDAATCSNIETLVHVQRLLGESLGRNVFIYSITVNPEQDSSAALRAFAEAHAVKHGWLFLTGEAPDLKVVRQRLFIHADGQDCSLHFIRYGNEAVGLWGGIPAKATPESIVQRLTWIAPGEIPLGPARRGGPFPPTSEG